MESKKKVQTPNPQKQSKPFTNAEQKLWQQLQHKQLSGAQFNYRKTVSIYTVDFYCEKTKLVIEINNAQHLDTVHLLKNSIRDQMLREHGVQVLRFNYYQVMMKTDTVVKAIYDAVNERLKLD